MLFSVGATVGASGYVLAAGDATKNHPSGVVNCRFNIRIFFRRNSFVSCIL